MRRSGLLSVAGSSAVACALVAGLPSAGAGSTGARATASAERPHETITLRSLGRSVQAPRGNSCGTACTRAYFPGHPTRTRLPVRPGGVLKVFHDDVAAEVLVRFYPGVTKGGGPRGRLLAEVRGTAASSTGGTWRVRVPRRARVGGGVSVRVSFTHWGVRTFYARVRPVRAR